MIEVGGSGERLPRLSRLERSRRRETRLFELLVVRDILEVL